MSVDSIPPEEFAKIRARVIDQINSMDYSELVIVAQSEQSLADFIGRAFKEIARLASYIIAIPLSYSMLMAKEVYQGIKSGWSAAFENAGVSFDDEEENKNIEIIMVCFHCGQKNRVKFELAKKRKAKCGRCGSYALLHTS